MSVRHFLSLTDLSSSELTALLKRATELKAIQKQKIIFEPFKNRVMAMIFEKSSTRTRVSFETGMAQFGGTALFLSPRDTQLGRGEPIEDTARVISRMVDIIMIRTFEQTKIERFAAYSQVPVINALTDEFHPCQLLADLQTFIEHRGALTGKTVAWIGDGNNMCHSYIHAAHLLNFELRIVTPKGFEPNAAILASTPNAILVNTPHDAVKGAHLIVTDTWVSMGQEQEEKNRLKQFEGFQVNPALMDKADPSALFMHCLPAHRGEEISDNMFDDPRSVVWDEAENRLHAQKALIEFLLTTS
jgi:ornithine carbamoyltransferase